MLYQLKYRYNEKSQRNSNVCGAVLCSNTLLNPVFGQKVSVLSDAEIASVAVVANQGDIGFGKIALKNRITLKC